MPRRSSVRARGCALALLLCTACSPGRASHDPHPAADTRHARAGAPGVGDALFPRLGNGGYDVAHYGLRLDYVPDGNHLKGTAAISARATRALSAFNLDLAGLRVRRATVDGEPAAVDRSGTELTLTPADPLRAGRTFEVTVAYDGTPKTITDPDGTEEGWIETEDGSAALGEPAGSMAWFPGNHHPSDKAAYDIDVTVPDGFTAVSGGELRSRERHGGRTTFRWHSGEPMASYLATVVVGTFDVRTSQPEDGGPPLYVATDPAQKHDARRVPAEVARITTWAAGLFGSYPFSSTGAVVDDLPDLDYALETQTRPYFSGAPDTVLLVHELAHQWFGDSVTPRRWKDVWLNEGFATYTEWLWEERHGGRTAQETFEDFISGADSDATGIWAFPPGDPPDAEHVLDPPVYGRGAMVLHQVRRAVGDETFFGILRTWVKDHRHGNADTGQFIALCEKRSGKDLGALFDTWLYGEDKPDTA